MIRGTHLHKSSQVARLYVMAIELSLSFAAHGIVSAVLHLDMKT